MIRKRTLIPIFLFASSPAFASPPPDDQAPKELINLRAELFEAGKTKALEQVPKFRPLCDDAGYPLVGNVIRKGKLFQPSEFCTEVRSRKSKT